MSLNLDPEVCYRAMQTKDIRFDGQFFVAVSTTKIYCRPICPATTPKRQNCTFYASAAAAQQAGFRPCLRCRPELSPHLLAYVGTAATVSRALRLIAEGSLDRGTVQDLASRLGVSDRHLRQLFTKHLGTSPLAVAQTRRLQFAKQLIDETTLSMTEIAIASGFASIRRFNAVIAKIYGRSPSELRRQTRAAAPTPTIALKLPFSPPYSWAAIVRFLIPRATPGVEVASLAGYRRSIAIGDRHGLIEVVPVEGRHYLMARIQAANVTLLAPVVERLRRLFDLNANTGEIAAHLQQDPLLAPIVSQQAGLRIPGAWDSFELAVRAILGQQISVRAATTLAGRLVAAYGEPLALTGADWSDAKIRLLFPRPEQLASADLTELGIPRPRARAIAALAATVAQTPDYFSQFQTLEAAIEALCQLPGIGEWTAHYIAIRALGEPDAFPASDLGLLRAMHSLGHSLTKAQLEDYSQRWRPWRAYAAMHLWLLDPAIGLKETRSA